MQVLERVLGSETLIDKLLLSTLVVSLGVAVGLIIWG